MTTRRSLARLAMHAVLCVTAAWSSTSFADDCPERDDVTAFLACKATAATGAVVTGLSGGAAAAGRALSLGTDVEVVLDDGRQVPGRLTRTASEGRIVETGDLVRLNCSEARLDAGYCQLEFTRLNTNNVRFLPRSDPRSSGRQPGWTIFVSPTGIPDDHLLTLDAPARAGRAR